MPPASGCCAAGRCCGISCPADPARVPPAAQAATAPFTMASHRRGKPTISTSLGCQRGSSSQRTSRCSNARLRLCFPLRPPRSRSTCRHRRRPTSPRARSASPSSRRRCRRHPVRPLAQRRLLLRSFLSSSHQRAACLLLQAAAGRRPRVLAAATYPPRLTLFACSGAPRSSSGNRPIYHAPT